MWSASSDGVAFRGRVIKETITPPNSSRFGGVLTILRMRFAARSRAGAVSAAVVAWALPLKLNIVVAIGVAVGLSLLLDRQREGAHHG